MSRVRSESGQKCGAQPHSLCDIAVAKLFEPTADENLPVGHIQLLSFDRDCFDLFKLDGLFADARRAG